VNCAAFVDGLAPSEFFGHVRGAFTGAERDKLGAFREASGGTLCLEEIGELKTHVPPEEAGLPLAYCLEITGQPEAAYQAYRELAESEPRNGYRRWIWAKYCRRSERSERSAPREAEAAKEPATPAEPAAGKPNAVDAAMKAAAQSASQLYNAPAKFEKILYNVLSGKAKGAMLRDMGAPEFTVADTNWGSAEDHTFFVVAPDPTTGEPALWKKTVPPGTLSPTTDDWIEAEWAAIR